MPRTERNETRAAIEAIFAAGQGGPPADRDTELAKIRAMHEELRGMVEKLTAPPWHLVRVVGVMACGARMRAVVAAPGAMFVVELGPEVEPSSLRRGQLAYLNAERNAIVGAPDTPLVSRGDTATFVRAAGEGRIVLRSRDEEILVETSDAIDLAALREGQPMLWDRAAFMALEALDHRPGQRFFLPDLAPVHAHALGGQHEALDRLIWALTAFVAEPRTAALYGIDGRRGILLVGRPGNGKTLMTRIAATRVAELCGVRCRFAVVRPAEFESPYVGETERMIRETFAALREAAANGDIVILFLDEIDAIGRIRGGLGGRHSDRSLAALLAEIDGFIGRGRVALVAASNRKDIIDPALLERISEIEIHVGRPTLEGARQIFGVHLAADLPFDGREGDAARLRETMIDVAVSRLYSPNGDNEVCRLRHRDGSTRAVRAAELVSGRLIEQICRGARSYALRRDIEEGRRGIRQSDLERAVADALDRLGSTLTPHNASAYLDDVTPDNDVVAVECVRRAVERPYRVLRAA